MPIQVTCPGCLKRFQVSEKFAGKQGPCPHCKHVITIPSASEQVVIHAPETAGPKSATGQPVLKPIKRQETKLTWPILAASLAGVIFFPLVAWIIGRNAPLEEGHRQIAPWILAVGALAVAPGIVMAGYSFLRNQELEPYRGTALWLRVLICSVVYAALWGGHAYLKVMLDMNSPLQIYQILMIVIPLFVPAILAAMASLDLDGLNAGIHFGMYFGTTVLLRMIMGLPVL